MQEPDWLRINHKTTIILGQINRIVKCKTPEVIVPLYSALECGVKFWASHFWKDVDELKKVHNQRFREPDL